MRLTTLIALLISTPAMAQLIDTSEVDRKVASGNLAAFCGCNTSNRANPHFSKPLPPGITRRDAEERCRALDDTYIELGGNRRRGIAGTLISLNSCNPNFYPEGATLEAEPSSAPSNSNSPEWVNAFDLPRLMALDKTVEDLKAQIRVLESRPSGGTTTEIRYVDRPSGGDSGSPSYPGGESSPHIPDPKKNPKGLTR